MEALNGLEFKWIKIMARYLLLQVCFYRIKEAIWYLK